MQPSLPTLAHSSASTKNQMTPTTITHIFYGGEYLEIVGGSQTRINEATVGMTPPHFPIRSYSALDNKITRLYSLWSECIACTSVAYVLASDPVSLEMRSPPLKILIG